MISSIGVFLLLGSGLGPSSVNISNHGGSPRPKHSYNVFYVASLPVKLIDVATCVQFWSMYILYLRDWPLHQFQHISTCRYWTPTICRSLFFGSHGSSTCFSWKSTGWSTFVYPIQVQNIATCQEDFSSNGDPPEKWMGTSKKWGYE